MQSIDLIRGQGSPTTIDVAEGLLQTPDSTPMRLLVLGDFSGRPVAERPPLATGATHMVDADTLDAVKQRVDPRIQMPAGSPNELPWGSGSLAATLLLGRGFNERGWDMERGDEREIGDLPAYTFTRDGQRELQPCAEQVLSERKIDRMIKAGLMPIVSHRDRNAVTAIRFQSIADRRHRWPGEIGSSGAESLRL